MGAPFPNPVVAGGGALVLPSIHSPGYVPDTAGWSVNQDGSADLANVTIRGTFNGTDWEISSTGLFFYSGTPASGNLIGSWAAVAGTDPYGNAYPAGLSIGADTAPQVLLVPGTGAGEAQVVFPLGTGNLTAPLAAGGTGSSSNGAYGFLNVWGSRNPLKQDQVLLTLNSSDSVSNANGELLYYDPAGNLHQFAYWDAGGFYVRNEADAQAYNAAAGHMVCTSSQASTGTYTLINGMSWTVGAGTYIIEAHIIAENTASVTAANIFIRLGGPARTFVMGSSQLTQIASGVTTAMQEHASLPASWATVPSYPSGALVAYTAHFWITFSAGGATQFLMKDNGTNPMSVYAGSYATITPVY